MKFVQVTLSSEYQTPIGTSIYRCEVDTGCIWKRFSKTVVRETYNLPFVSFSFPFCTTFL